MFKSFCITVRPKNGLSDDLLEALIKRVKKYDYGFICTEKEEECKHAHIQIWLNEAVPKGTIATAFQRIQSKSDPDWSEASNKVLRQGIKIAYNDWYLDYCELNELKIDEDISRILYSNPPCITLNYYASEVEQEKILARSNSSNKYYYTLKERFIQDNWILKYPGDTYTVAEFVCNEMFVKDRIPIIKDPKQRRWLCICLLKYIEKDFIPDDLFSDKELQLHLERLKLNK